MIPDKVISSSKDTAIAAVDILKSELGFRLADGTVTNLAGRVALKGRALCVGVIIEGAKAGKWLTFANLGLATMKLKFLTANLAVLTGDVIFIEAATTNAYYRIAANAADLAVGTQTVGTVVTNAKADANGLVEVLVRMQFTLN